MAEVHMLSHLPFFVCLDETLYGTLIVPSRFRAGIDTFIETRLNNIAKTYVQ